MEVDTLSVQSRIVSEGIEIGDHKKSKARMERKYLTESIIEFNRIEEKDHKSVEEVAGVGSGNYGPNHSKI